jgi:hypothetical protein
MENRTSFISCGIAVTIMNGFREPTQVNLKYQHQGNNFLMYCLEASSQPKPITISPESESSESDRG